MKEMYSAVVNSPRTELSEGIDAMQTVISVLNADVFEDTKIAVIGNGEAAETIRYESIKGIELLGCERGYQGVAKAWVAGTRLARNFTADDWNTAKVNIEGLYDRLDTADTAPVTLQPGLQVITAECDARFRLGEIQGKSEINGQGRIGIIGVENPYIYSKDSEDEDAEILSMLAFQTELHANPDTGAEPDKLFEHNNGQYNALRKWGKVVLDGSLSWRGDPGASVPGAKVFYVRDGSMLAKDYISWVTKYDGTLLGNRTTASFTGADQSLVYGNAIHIVVSNTDSGWGPDYNQTADETKAYFNGWKMYHVESQSYSSEYNGVGQKAWVSRADMSNFGGVTVPTTVSPNWTPYNLLYRLAQEVVEPVTYEGSLTLHEGDNMVEVGSGIVLRERAKAVLLDKWYINWLNGGSSLANKVDKFKNVYENNKEFREWFVDSWEAYGKERVNIAKQNYDQSAAYSVTYLKLDKSPVVPISGVVAANEKAQLVDLTAGVAEALHGVSVLSMEKAEKDAPGWITPTLLNGWGVYGGYSALSIRKYSNTLYFDGLIRGGAYSPSVIIAILPIGYRTSGNKVIEVPCMDNSGVYTSAHLIINSTGHISIFSAPGNAYLSFANVSFSID